MEVLRLTLAALLALACLLLNAGMQGKARKDLIATAAKETAPDRTVATHMNTDYEEGLQAIIEEMKRENEALKHDKEILEQENQEMKKRLGNSSGMSASTSTKTALRSISSNSTKSAVTSFLRASTSTTTSTIVHDNVDDRPPFHCRLSETENLTLPAFPSFIIPGTQKGGTSALYSLLKQVPNILEAERFETHFFDFNGHLHDSFHNPNRTKRCQVVQQFYMTNWFRNETHFRDGTLVDTVGYNPENMPLTFEKTPSYITLPTIPAMIRDTVGMPKIVIILRNPVARAYSHWKMSYDTNFHQIRSNNKTFDDEVVSSIGALIRKGVLTVPTLEEFADKYARDGTTSIDVKFHKESEFGNTLYRGFYSRQVKHWLDVFPPDKIGFWSNEALNSDKRRVLTEILEFVGYKKDRVPSVVESILAVDKDFSPVKESKRHVYPPLTDTTRAYLEAVYKPFNQELADVLGEEWRGIWD